MATRSNSKAAPKASTRASAPGKTAASKKTSTTAAARKRPALSVVSAGKAVEPAARQEAVSPAPARKPKRTMTTKNIGRTLNNAAVTLPTVYKIFTEPDISPALREKIVLSVASVNNSRYCKWAHSHWAMAHGVSLDEVNEIIGHDDEALSARDEAEVAAILFARQYPQRLDRIDEEAVEELRAHFSQQQIDEIIASIYAITLGNLIGNTVDSFFSRFRTHGKNSIFLEAAVAAFGAPIAGAAALAARFMPGPKIEEMRVAKAYGVDEV